MGVAVSLLGEAACSEQFLVLWHALVGLLHDQFPGMVSHTQEKKKNLSSTEWKALSVLKAPVLLLPDVNLTGLGVGAWGWGMSIFSSHSSLMQFHSWGWLRGVVLPGDRGMAQRCSLAWSHYVTFPVTLGKLLFKNLPLSSYKSSPSPQISPNTEIQDINKAFGLSSSEGEPENRALFSS